MRSSGQILAAATSAMLALVPAIAGSVPAATAALNVTPLRLEFKPGQQSSQLLLRNDSAQRLAVQFRLFAWTQDEAGDHYELSQDFVISPSIVQIGPGLTQTFHVVSREPVPSSRERAYRVVIDQLPQSVQSVDGAAQTRLRITLPLFSGSGAASEGKLHFAVRGKMLTILNVGGRSIKLDDTAIMQGGKVVALPNEKGPHYVLGGARLQFALPPGIACKGPEIRVIGHIERKAFDEAAPQICA